MEQEDKALLMVDVQNDFCPGGALAVPEGDSIIPVLNRYIDVFSSKDLPIIASRDWHPEETKHFKEFGGLWPKHCVRGTKGARFHPQLKITDETIIVSKGTDPTREGYSVFQAYDPQGNDFPKVLRLLEVKELCVGGLATDYCVKETVLDALKRGLKVNLLKDAIRGVDKKDSQKAVKEMVENGAKEVVFDKLFRVMV